MELSSCQERRDVVWLFERGKPTVTYKPYSLKGIFQVVVNDWVARSVYPDFLIQGNRDGTG
jgi:hypothetical protein